MLMMDFTRASIHDLKVQKKATTTTLDYFAPHTYRQEGPQVDSRNGWAQICTKQLIMYHHEKIDSGVKTFLLCIITHAFQAKGEINGHIAVLPSLMPLDELECMREEDEGE